MILSFRKMQPGDLDEVVQIEQEAFTDAWFKELFAMELDHDAYVAVCDEKIAGYICAWQVLDECTITNIAVKPELQRNGIAQYLFAELNRIMDNLQVRYYYLEVRLSNSPARTLYKKLGFTQIGLRKSYYHNPVEDAVVMSWDKLSDSESRNQP